MKAIVLSFDKQSGLVELTYKKYMELWPDCPLQFRVPYNGKSTNKSYEYFKTKKNVELVKTPVDIRSTMQTLLNDLDDDEWVYWCIDDRYPIEIKNFGLLNNIYKTVVNGDVDRLNAVKLFAWKEELTGEALEIGGLGYRLQKPATLFGFWHHYFIKVAVLKYFFLSGNLSKKYSISDLTTTYHFKKEISRLTYTAVPEQDILILGEPCFEGKLTSNGYELLKRYNCPIPPYKTLPLKKDFIHKDIPAVKSKGTRLSRADADMKADAGIRNHSFIHLINPVKLPPDNDFYKAQQITFKAIEDAWNLRGGLSVELRTAQFKEDGDVTPSIFSPTPDLNRSVLDDRAFTLKRKLPFLADILDRILKYSSAEYAVFTNVDIIPSSDFYLSINELINSGNIAFTINRRTIEKNPNTPEKMDEILSQAGKSHPGHDCFIFPRVWIEQFDVGKVVIGVPWLGFVLLANMACYNKGINVFQQLYLTRHLGDDANWTLPEHLQYRDYNAIEAEEVLNRLQRRYGSFKPESYLGKHVTLAKQQVVMAKQRGADIKSVSRSDNRLTFCINSGRSGSEYLKVLLGSAGRVTAFHEAKPAMSDNCLKMVTDHPLEETFTQRYEKVLAVKEALNHLPPGQVYAETNHMFVKTFYDVIMESFPHELLTVIILRRGLVKVLKSFITMGYFSERNEVWPLWMHRVPSKNSVLKPYKSYEEMDTLDRAISYLIDIEAKAQAFKRDFPGCNIVEIDLEDLQDYQSVSKFFKNIGIEPTPYTEEIVGSVINTRQERKDALQIETNEGHCRERIINYIEKSRKYGIDLPDLPQFKEN